MGKKANPVEEKRRPGPMKVAAPTDKAWIPGIGVISVAELGEKLKQGKKGKELFEKGEMIKEILTELKELSVVEGIKGTFTTKMYKEVNAKFKEKHGRKVGINKGNLMRKGFISRAKFEGFPPLFFITQAGMEFLGEKTVAPPPAPEEAPSAAEEALKAIAEK